MSSFDFQVDKNTLSKHQLIAPKLPVLTSGEVRLSIERFSLTSNNVTYGVMGESLGYWDFFPVKDNWGKIPVWGIGIVVESHCNNIAVGSKFYGYYPMSSEFIVQPENVSNKGFKDVTSHRQSLASSYNHYSLMVKENGFLPDADNYYILYRPLFSSGLLLEDYLRENEYFGATTLLISSASSKTAISLAFMLGKLGGVKSIGLTSPKNLSFVKSLGLYDEVICYNELDDIQANRKITYVDICGDSVLLQKIQSQLNNRLVHRCVVGGTHSTIKNKKKNDSLIVTTLTKLAASKQSQFFAPTHIEKCQKTLGTDGFSQHFQQSWVAFLAQVDEWIDIVEFSAQEDLSSVYDSLLITSNPKQGLILVNDEFK